MDRNGDLRRNPDTGQREIYYDPPGRWEVLDVATHPDNLPVPEAVLGQDAGDAEP